MSSTRTLLFEKYIDQAHQSFYEMQVKGKTDAEFMYFIDSLKKAAIGARLAYSVLRRGDDIVKISQIAI